MSDNSRSIQDHLDEHNNSNESEQLGRLIKLTVERVGTRVPPPKRYLEKRTSIRVVEMNKQSARSLRDFLTGRLEDHVPGAISFVLYGREEL